MEPINLAGPTLPPVQLSFNNNILKDVAFPSRPMATKPPPITIVNEPSTEVYPELIACEVIHKEDKGDEIELRLINPAGIEATQTRNGTFRWIIGTTHSRHIPLLNTVSMAEFDHPFTELSVPVDHGIRKTAWREDILNIHLSRFTVDHENPLKVVRHVVEMLVGNHVIFSLDQSDDNAQLLALRRAFLDRRVPHYHMKSVASLANRIVEQILSDNAEVLDRLASILQDLELKVTKAPLEGDEISKDVPTLLQTVRYFHRKSFEANEILRALDELQRDNANVRGNCDPDRVMTGSMSALKNILERSSEMQQRVIAIQTEHDRQRKVRSDNILERLTVPITLSAPPILADFICKYPLQHYESLHTPVMVGSILMGVALVLVAKATDWRELRVPSWRTFIGDGIRHAKTFWSNVSLDFVGRYKDRIMTNLQSYFAKRKCSLQEYSRTFDKYKSVQH